MPRTKSFPREIFILLNVNFIEVFAEIRRTGEPYALSADGGLPAIRGGWTLRYLNRSTMTRHFRSRKEAVRYITDSGWNISATVKLSDEEVPS